MPIAATVLSFVTAVKRNVPVCTGAWHDGVGEVASNEAAMSDASNMMNLTERGEASRYVGLYANLAGKFRFGESKRTTVSGSLNFDTT
jgi:hypothetical protein